MLLGKPTAANRPYELGLTSKYKYTLEKRARMGRYTDDDNELVKAFSDLQLS